jgi:hypothetical protein
MLQVSLSLSLSLSLPPAIIFPRKRMKPEIFKDVHEGTIPMISDNGFLNMELFISWLKHLNRCVKSTEDESVLFRLDSHFSQIRHEAVALCREQDITLLSLTPHSSHKLQLPVGHL